MIKHEKTNQNNKKNMTTDTVMDQSDPGNPLIQPLQTNKGEKKNPALLMNLSCSSACLAILTACLDKISFV